MRRHLIGILGLAGLAAFLTMLVSGSAVSGRGAMFASVMMRVGLIFCMSWLAYPQLERIGKRLPLWAWGLIGGMLVVLVANPKLFPIAFALFAAIAVFQFIGWLFKPPVARKPSSNDPKN